MDAIDELYISLAALKSKKKSLDPEERRQGSIHEDDGGFVKDRWRVSSQPPRDEAKQTGIEEDD